MSKPKAEDTRKRSKRPEIQRYIPKGRLAEKQTADLSGEGSGDLEAESSPNHSAVHSPSPGPGKVAHSPSPRKVDMKNMQVTVVNVKPEDSQYESNDTVKESEQQGVNRSQREQTGFIRGRGRGQGQSYSRGRGQRMTQKSDRGRGRNEMRSGGDSFGSRGNSQEKSGFSSDTNSNRDEKDLKDTYLVPSRPNTIGQEADRVDTIGSDQQLVQNDELLSKHENLGIVSGLSKHSSNRSKSRSFDKLNQADRWEEEGYFPDSSNLGTLIFERSRSSEQLNLTGKNVHKPPMPRSSSGGNKGAKKYPIPAMRQRRDSFSSDISTGEDVIP